MMDKNRVKKFVEGYLSECGALMNCGKNCKKDDLKNCGGKKECSKKESGESDFNVEELSRTVFKELPKWLQVYITDCEGLGWHTWNEGMSTYDKEILIKDAILNDAPEICGESIKESKSPVLGSEWISDKDASHVKICGTPDEHTVEFCNIDGTGKKSMDRQEFLSNFQ